MSAKFLEALIKWAFVGLIVFALVDNCNGQVRRGTVSVNGASYGVYTSPDSYGGTHYSFRSDGHALTAPRISTEIPMAYEQKSFYAGPDTSHFIDSLKITTRASALWMLHNSTSKYKGIHDPDYRRMIIEFCKEDGTIPKEYVE